MFHSINPATGAGLESRPAHGRAEVDAALGEAVETQREWSGVDVVGRSAQMREAARVLRANAAAHAELMTREMGKPIAQARAEVEKCAWVCDYYADHSREFLADREADSDASRSFVSFQPLGVVLAIMPWNFPLWQAFRAAVPALMAGDAVLIKHAPNVPGCAAAIEGVFTSAGFPRGLVRNLFVPVDEIEAIIGDARVCGVTLTGSVSVGRAVAAAAGRGLKKTVLELGGSDPYIILEDANLEEAVSSCVTGRLINSGQSCIAAKRFIVVHEVYDRFRDLFVAAMAEKKTGDPFDESSDLGPLAREDIREALDRQVRSSVDGGARVLLGGEIPDGPGWFYSPTVLDGVVKGTPAYEEELFGPVAALIPAVDEEEAVRIANDTNFGLGAAVFCGDPSHGAALARNRLAAGSVFVNTYVRSDPRLPFGGIKNSGYGRELSLFGIHEFVNVKTIYVK